MAYGKDKLSIDYFAVMYNREFIDVLKRTNEIGKKEKMIAMAYKMLTENLSETKK